MKKERGPANSWECRHGHTAVIVQVIDVTKNITRLSSSGVIISIVIIL